MNTPQPNFSRVIWSTRVHLVHPWHTWTLCGRDLPMDRLRYLDDERKVKLHRLCKSCVWKEMFGPWQR